MDGCACIGNWDGDPAEFCAVTTRKARKPHVCCECGCPIQPGEQYESVTGKWEGEILRMKTCLLCVEIGEAFACGGGWTYACLWDDLREGVYPTLSMCCLQKLSIEAQRKVARDYSTTYMGRCPMTEIPEKGE
jgi:hypothetical protein